MNLPNKILLQARCDESCNLNGLIFVMRVQSGTKNSYSICFPKTNDSGLSVLESEDFRGQFEDHHALALMDYNGTIESACETVGIDLLNVKQMVKSGAFDWQLTAHERKFWKSKLDRTNYFLSAANEKFFSFPTAVKIKAEAPIEVTVGKKSSSKP